MRGYLGASGLVDSLPRSNPGACIRVFGDVYVYLATLRVVRGSEGVFGVIWAR